MSVIGQVEVNTALILALIVLDVVLIARLIRLTGEQERQDSVVRTVLTDIHQQQELIAAQQKTMEQGMRLLAEIAAHIEVGMGRARFSGPTREILAQLAEQPPDYAAARSGSG